MAKSTDTSAITESKEASFSKEQLLSSKKYAKRRDLLAALLKDDETYTTREVDATIKKFMKEAI